MSDAHLMPHVVPGPGDAYEMMRWEHSRLRRRLLNGQWEPDLITRLVLEVGGDRTSAWGKAKTVSMPHAQISRELSALYMREPAVRAEKGDLIFGQLAKSIKGSGLWAQATSFQTHVIGLREACWRPTAFRDGRIRYRPVWPDMLLCQADGDTPDQPVEMKELRYRDGFGWCWDILSVASPMNPVYRVERANGADVSAEVLKGDFSGKRYPHRFNDGAPFLPLVMYHAESLGDQLWHWQHGIETVEASLDLAVGYTMLGHILKDASWPQRYTVGCSPAGMDSDSESSSIVTDPASVLRLVKDADYEGQPLVGQWIAGADPEKFEAVLASLCNRIAIEAGLPASDIQKMGGTARSGYAISLSNEGKRVAARKFAPSFKVADERLISISAAMLNRAMGTRLPELGYTVTYQDLPLSPDELASRRTNILEMRTAKLISRRDAYMELHPGLTPAQTDAELAAIDAEEAAAPSASAPADTDTDTPAPAAVEPAAVPDPAVAVADTALNGAQGVALLGVLKDVSAGVLAPSAAKRALRIMNPAADPAEIDLMVDESAAFKPAVPVVPVAA